MAEAGSVAEKVKQQADIVRVVGEYVRLKKAGKDFSGLCPFHQEKTPSFTVSPIKQIFYCFGCGKGGDVYNFVMEMEKCEFPEAVRLVAEKCGISIPRSKERSGEERKENQQRATLVEMHREAQTFFVKQLEGTLEGKAARAYLEDRGLDKDAVSRFGIGYAPSGGDTLLRHLKSKYNEKLLVESGLISRDQGGKLFDRFRRRITFPIANESGKVIAFGCRALGDDQPKYLNSPESPIYSKSNVLYHLDRAKEGIRRQDFVILVEGYMDAIAVARAGISNVVASCGTSLAEQQIKLLGRFTKRVVVNYDPDTAGQSATERSLSLLLEQDFEVRVLALPPLGDKKADPDLYIREKGAEEYQKRLKEAPSFVDYLIARARQMDLSSGEAKTRAVNFLLPYVQKIPNRILRSEWATRIAQHLRLEEPVLRAALSKAASERRSELKTQPELVPSAVKQAERCLISRLTQEGSLRGALAQRLQEDPGLYQGLEAEKIFAVLAVAALSEKPLQVTEVATVLEEDDRRSLFEILLKASEPVIWREVESCLAVLRIRRLKMQRDDAQRLYQQECVTKGIDSPESLQLRTVIQNLLDQLQAEEAAQEIEQKTKAKDERDPVLEEIQKKIENSLRDMGLRK
ncbi:MAG: DNA primase [Acidobacteria bacterium]|nr:MAG: DNA primase [Acidobacteriota bacterium]